MPFNQKDNEVRERVRTMVLTSSSVLFCLISCSTAGLSSSSTAARSRSLFTRLMERYASVELLVDPELDPVVWVDAGDNAGVSVCIDQVESSVVWRVAGAMLSSSESRRPLEMPDLNGSCSALPRLTRRSVSRLICLRFDGVSPGKDLVGWMARLRVEC